MNQGGGVLQSKEEARFLHVAGKGDMVRYLGLAAHVSKAGSL